REVVRWLLLIAVGKSQSGARGGGVQGGVAAEGHPGRRRAPRHHERPTAIVWPTDSLREISRSALCRNGCTGACDQLGTRAHATDLRRNAVSSLRSENQNEGRTKRDRRVSPDEERRLLESADILNCAEHAFAGAHMRDRIVAA